MTPATPPDGGHPGRSRPRAARAVLALLLGVGVLLAVNLPQQVDQRLTLRIRCASGAAVTGVWVEAENGGSGFAEPDGDGVFVFHLAFGGEYGVNVGCGGSRQSWAKEARSEPGTSPDRVLVCDDTGEARLGPCRDER